jgi:PKD repeat protein
MSNSNFPEALDTNLDLYEVHDGLRVRLAEDYLPGDTTITVFGDEEIMRRFPDTGLLTLVEQCSDAEERAISFYYGVRTLTTFEELELLPGFTDSVKPKNITNVVQNVMADHHNIIKNALIAIQRYAGKKGETATQPLDGTMEARTNYLRNLALGPKAWFSVDKNIGLVPMTVEFTNSSFRTGTDGTSTTVKYIWDFGDNTGPSIITIEATDEVPVDATDVLVEDTDGDTILKTYTTPGLYDVKLTVINDFGQDTVILPGIVNPRIQAPDEAVMVFVPRTNQIYTAGVPTDGPYTTQPKIRSPINTLIDIQIPSGVNPNTDKSYAGEQLDGNNHAIDSIAEYTWSLADDLVHGNSSVTRASYSVGGVYDLILRVDTRFGAYRITTYEDVLDIVEKDNMWLWTFTDEDVYSYEFGLISETFKTKSNASLTIDYNDSFLNDEPNEVQQKREFRRNNGFAQRGTTSSGNGGSGLLYWSGGRSSAQLPNDENIEIREFNGFNDTYITRPHVSRPWNWVSLASANKLYFAFGGVTGDINPDTSPTNQYKHTLALNSLAVTTTTFADGNYKNGANELKQNEVTFAEDGSPIQGHMSVYRSCWREDTGYILRNEGIGDFFRIKSFYKTSGNTSEPFQDIRKLPDMSGPAKVEGQLVPLKLGVFFFNNSGSVSAYNPTSGVWETGGPGVNSATFRLLQDNTIVGFDDPGNTLIATSDSDQVVYLSYDYSESALLKFNATDLTFTKIGQRPAGNQWQACIF